MKYRDKHARAQSARDCPWPLCNARKFHGHRTVRTGLRTLAEAGGDTGGGRKGFAKVEAHRVIRRFARKAILSGCFLDPDEN